MTLCNICSKTIPMETYAASHGTCGKPACVKFTMNLRSKKQPTRTLAHYQFPIDRIREVEAARAMLAALEAVYSNPRPAEGSRSHEDTWEERYQRYLEAMCSAKDAIAAAKAAGIKAEG